MAAQAAQVAPNELAVLSKAVVRATALLGLPNRSLAKILGLSEPTVSRLLKGAYQLKPGHKEWEFALLFVRAYRALNSIVGDDATARAWLRSENVALNARPMELLEQTEGLVRVVQYLDASRGRL